MMLFFRFIWPRSRKSLAVWVPLIAAGFIACIGLSLAMGFRSGVLAQQASAVLRDGGSGFGPNIEPPTLDPDGPPLRSSELISTGYGPMTVTTFWGVEGQRIGSPGIDRVEKPGTVLASPAVIDRLDDDWTGDLGAWLGERQPGRLPDAALAHPREMVIVEFVDDVPSDGAAKAFHPVRARTPRYAEDTSFVVVGLLILVLPSMALARAAASVHLNTRSRRYGLLRVLGAQPRQLAVVIAADMAAPMLAGAFIGSIVYAVVMGSLDSFTLAGSSYWTSDLRLSIPLAIALPFAAAAVGMVSVARMVYRAGRDPIGTLRRRSTGLRILSYALAAGAIAGPVAVIIAAEMERSASIWTITAGLLLSIIGVEGMSRIAVALAGKALVTLTRAQIAGARMLRSGADSLLGVSATSVAVVLIVFFVYGNFNPSPPDIGNFDLVAWVRGDTNVTSMERVGNAAEGYEGVTRVVRVGSHNSALVDGGIRLYTMTCEDVPGSVEIDAPCETGRVYLGREPESNMVLVSGRGGERSSPPVGASEPGGTAASPVPTPTIPPQYRALVTTPVPLDPSLIGSFPVGGRVTSSWTDNNPVMMVDEQPPVEISVLLITTDGRGESMRGVIQGLRQFPDVQSTTLRAALTSGFNSDTLILNPYLFVMATTAAGIAAVALLYAVLLLFRQRQAEFKMLRCQGATRMLLSVDLSLLFAVPLILSFGLALASGTALAVAYNLAFDVPPPQVSPQAISVLVIVAAVGVAATALVAGFATRVSPLIADPDAAAA